MERRQIRSALHACGFTKKEERDYIVDTEFGDWISFASVNSDVFAALGNRLATAGCKVTPTRMYNLSVLKFWVEDKYRMKEHKDATVFRREKDDYLLLYQTFLTAQHMSRTLPNGPMFSVHNFDAFYSGTKQVFQSILGVGGVPLSYVIQDMKNRPKHSVIENLPRDKKIYWRASFHGADFRADNHRVWMYLLQRCRDTPGLIRIQRYVDNGRAAWEALLRNHGIVDTEPPDYTTYEDGNYTYIIHHLPIYSDIYDQWNNADRGGHGPTLTEKMDLELEFFTGSKCRGIIYGFNMNPTAIHPESVREIARRPSSDTPTNFDIESLEVSVKRTSELLRTVGTINKFAQVALQTLERMGIEHNHDLNLTLRQITRDASTKQKFIRLFSTHSGRGYILSDLEVFFLRKTAHYMTHRYDYDHEYFQRMIERSARANPDKNIPLGIAEGNQQMILLGLRQGIDEHHPNVLALANVEGVPTHGYD